ncbi:putative Nonribosomal peptide synthetase [Seiridium unicorne]|uniref:Nonribosomal peptide synthetase n=1 Tax=Seiridium unicorne TaxID=138068 RepID=A0ABR2URE8_9PEZI
MVANGDCGPPGALASLATFSTEIESLKSVDSSVQSRPTSPDTLELTKEAGSFWKEMFRGLSAPQFPSLPHGSYEAKADKYVDHVVVAHIKWPEMTEVVPTVIQAALAFLISWKDDTLDVVFGVQVNGSGLPDVEVDAQSALVPFGVTLDKEMTIEHWLNVISKRVIEMRGVPTGPKILERIRLLGAEPRRAANFQTLLVAHPLPLRCLSMGYEDPVMNRAMVISYERKDSSLQLQAAVDSTICSEEEGLRILKQLGHIVGKLCSDASIKLKDIPMITNEELETIWSWNAELPETVKSSVHALISEMAQKHPDAVAVCAWDGDLTYSQLGSLSTRLASHLLERGVCAGTYTPICFEKSKMVPVAMLAVIKTGGGGVLLDIEMPESRLRSIVDQLPAKLIISSALQTELCEKITSMEAFILSELTMDDVPGLSTSLPPVQPSSPLCLVFTSGSTGAPKGAILTHEGFCSAIKHQRSVLGLHQETRLYDFASYAFDNAWAIPLHVFAIGGCVCIPSQEDRRNNIAGSINRLSANQVILTPTVLRLLDPAEIPAVKKVAFTGEPMSREDASRWPNVEILNIYGPAECTVFSTIGRVDTNLEGEPSIGHGVGLVPWVVHQGEKQLAPIGSIGELWLEGPLVGAGYLNNPEKTAEAFTEDPEWLLRGTLATADGQMVSGRHGRLYRTGDLVRYNSDGSLQHMGRSDGQVKIRGQRVELGDIEHHVRQVLPFRAEQVVVDITIPETTKTKTLTGFIATDIPVDEVTSMLDGIESELTARIPVWMVPSLWIPLQSFPTTATSKTDRRALREMGTKMDLQCNATSSNPKQSQEPLSSDESRLRSLWSSILGMEPEQIRVDDSFIRLGGHSITAMHLVAAARREGLSLTVGQILAQPRLKDLAKLMGHIDNGNGNLVDFVEPFSLLRSGLMISGARKQVAELCHAEESAVEDIFPCTALQEGLLAMTAKRPGDYISRIVAELRLGTDITKLKQAWEEVSSQVAPILRTRIVDLPGQGLVQVVLREPIPWDLSDVNNIIDKTAKMGLGTPLTRLGIMADGTSLYFTWTQHHAVYDGWSLPLIERAVTASYQQEKPEALVQPQHFVKYINDSIGHEAFWRGEFSNFGASNFPTLPMSNYQPHADKSCEHQVQDLAWPQDVTTDSVIRAAWATLLSWYGESPDVVFGVVVSGRQAPVPGIERLAGPTIATIPLRTLVEPKSSLEDMRQQMQRQAIRMIPFEQMGLQNIRRVSEEADRGCQFQSLLVVQPEIGPGGTSADSPMFEKGVVFQGSINEEDQNRVEAPGLDSIGVDVFNTYGITLHCQRSGSSLNLKMAFDSAVISETAARRMMHHFGHVLRQFCSPAANTTSLAEMDMLPSEDLHQIWQWNANLPETVEKCVHDIIAESACRFPDKVAICAWDGELTYAQLDDFSTRLAHQFIDTGIRPGDIVPLCFEKSKCMPIAQIAVMKAGAACVTIDPSQTEERLKYIIEYVGSELIVCASSTANLVLSLTGKAPFVVSIDTILGSKQENTEDDFELVLPTVHPSDLLFAVFTSGSTGNPKGAMVTHSNFTSAVEHQKDLLKFTETSKVADFCSYAFDVSWSNLIHTLAAGACLCIPSEHERKHDFVKFLIKHEVNYVHLTPSTATFLELDSVPTLETLQLSGELVDFDKLPHVKGIETVIITYGPAECTVTTSGISNHESPEKASIGLAAGTRTWVVNPEKDALMPIGLVGELFVEGPLVGGGYLSNPERTSAAFINDPSWLLRGSPQVEGRRGRLYRTGDLVRYTDDGELIFAGRKDTQVKLRGHRTDLSDIEHHIVRILSSTPEVADAIVEVVTPKLTGRQILVAFLRMPGLDEEVPMARATSIIEFLVGEMAKEFRQTIIPNLCIPRADLPMTATGKTDRKALRDIGAGLDLKAWSEINKSNSTGHVEPSTYVEVYLRSLWASVLNLSPEHIGVYDNFFGLGGDSIAAMRLSTALGRRGMILTVPEIFSQPQLNEMAKLVSPVDEVQTIQPIEPFSLLKAEIDRQSACQQVAESCSAAGYHIDPSQVEDIFPCTALQEGLLAMTARSDGDYVQQLIAELHPDIDESRFQKAWDLVATKASVLRTRIVDLPGQGWVQVVLRESLQWDPSPSILAHQDGHRDGEPATEIAEGGEAGRTMGPGTPLSCLAIIHDEDGRRFFAWTQHHAIYDGWSLAQLQRDIEKAYAGEDEELSSLPMQSFVKNVIAQHGKPEMSFWEQQFSGLETTQFPTLSEKAYQPRADATINHSIRGIQWPASGITPSSFIRAAWGTLMSWYVDCPDVTFGAVVSGRQASVPGIEVVAGPTIATVPIRIEMQGTVDEMLHRVQRQSTLMVPFEQLGLQHIRQVSREAKLACEFQSLLLIQPPIDRTTADSRIFKDALTERGEGFTSFNTYAIMLTCQIAPSALHMHMSFDSNVLTEQVATRLLQQFEHIIQQLSTVSHSTAISDLSRVSAQDLADIWKWNAQLPGTADQLVHDVFAERVAEDSSAPAVSSWDGDLSYGQLDQLSTLLAHYLLASGVGLEPGDIVPLCFDKSKWVPVAALAVMKSGAASVTLDATLPQDRLRSIVGQLPAKMILTSVACHNLSSQIADLPVIEVGEALHDLRISEPILRLPKISSSDPLYIVFTSGSTGLPKGAIVTHANFCSAIRHQQRQLGFEKTSRVFDYTSYAFDVAWSNILHTLTVGGCLCIPSEDDRTSDIAGSVARLQANFVHLTPTVGRLIDPKAFAGVKKLLFIGEALKATDVTRWKGSGVEIYNTYGPAECTITSTIEKIDMNDYVDQKAPLSDPGIGTGVGTLTWVVQPRAPDRLAAIGTVGELWLEGPIVGAGYLNNPSKTAEAFFSDPEWLVQRGPGSKPGRHGYLYRTGDLVYYKPDGSLGYVGRKDTQVKINGQRLELGEVEYYVRQLLPSDIEVVAEVITPDIIPTPTLAVFLRITDDLGSVQDQNMIPSIIVRLKKDLSKRLPSYMIPGAFVPVVSMPMTATGKTDRRAVRQLGKGYTPPQVLSTVVSASQTLLTNTEETLRDVWSELLGIKPDLITTDHSFAEIGGDSIKTMSLAVAIRKQWNIKIGVPRLVGGSNSLRELATLIDNVRRGQEAKQPTTIDVESEIEMLANQLRDGSSTSGKTVFLTGSTGFLGTQILYHLLTKRAFDRVVLLVRAINGKKGVERVKQAAQVAGWWKKSYASAIEVWDGDLAQPGLGLNNSQWDALRGLPSADGIIDAIIHNGAAVHWSTTYDRLKAANVGSTMHLLQATMASPFIKSFVYVSGGLITAHRTWTDQEAKDATGYDQTKYVSERLVSAVAAKCSKPDTKFSVIKPGQIIGDVYTGVANPDDFLWRVVVTASQLGIRPREQRESWLSISDARHISQLILQHAHGKSAEQFVQVTRGVWMSTFWASVEDQLSIQLREVSWDEWVEVAKKDMDRTRELHPLWPVQQFLGEIGTTRTDDDKCEWDMEEIVAAIRRNVEYLQAMGLADGSRTFGGAVNRQVTSRTRLADTMIVS